MAKARGWLESRIDLVAMSLLVVAVVTYGALFVDFKVPPFEDAAMLMRYAEHLANGYGVVWNIGEHPVDGATDFLFMTAVAALIKAGLGIGRSVRVLGYAAHLLTVLLVYWANRKLWSAHAAIAFIAALYLALGNGLWYVAAYFGTPVFALGVAATWVLGLLLAHRDKQPAWLCALFSVSCWITALIRPEGAVFGFLVLVAVIFIRGWSRSVRLAVIFAAVMLLLGGAYFLWHWNYFGYPLPNPFYKKGGGLLHWDSFWESLANLVRFGGPFLLAYVLGLRSQRTLKLTIAFAIPLVFFAAAFALVSNETNYGGRFQYALWPVVLLSFYPLIGGLREELGLTWTTPGGSLARGAWLLVALSLCYGVVRYGVLQSCSLTTSQQTCGVAFEADGRYDVAKMLAAYQGKGYVLATTEAGLLPLYSNWTAIDTWGLNDAWIAHHGGITAAYLDQFKPNLIVFHAYFSPLVPAKINDRNLSQDWFRMTITLRDYAVSHDYVLAAAFGDSPYESHYYYVRRDFPDSDRIAHSIATMRDYYWFATGKKALNYAEFQP